MNVELDQNGLLKFYIIHNLKPVLGIIAIVFAFLVGFLNIPVHIIFSYLVDIRIIYHLIMATFVFGGLIYLLSSIESRQFNCKIQDNALTLEYGIIERHKKSIPLNHITDVSTYMGLMDRIIGIVILGVQTAGAGSKRPELILIAPKDPDSIVNALINNKNNKIE